MNECVLLLVLFGMLGWSVFGGYTDSCGGGCDVRFCGGGWLVCVYL